MRWLVALVAAASAESAFAQPRISPRLEHWGGSSFVVTLRPGADLLRARDRLREQGFDLLEHPGLRPHDLLIAGSRSRLRALAAWDDVAAVFPASQELTAREDVVACGGPLTVEAPDGVAEDYVVNGRGWSRDSSGAAALRYAFQTMSAKLDDNGARAEIERAMREWEKYANVSFTQTDNPNGTRTIAIQFASGAHGDSYPFDGPNGSLAHTFYPSPPNPEPIAGNMHFDATENWHIGTSIDLYSVALHELGHALGLGHSDLPGAVMYPYYKQAYGLTDDDIAGAQSLYGARGSSTPTTPGTGSTPASPTTPTTPASPSDRTPPALAIASPAKTIVTTTAASIAISGAASDNTGVAAVKWTTSTGDAGTAAGTTAWSATIPLYKGTTAITVRAYDAAGNSSWRSITVTRR